MGLGQSTSSLVVELPPTDGESEPLARPIGLSPAPSGRVDDKLSAWDRQPMDTPMRSDAKTRLAIEEHWQASERGDIEAEHVIYAAEAILDYPQSGERFRGRPTISAQRGGHPASRHFTVLRIEGRGDLWVSECVITYDDLPTYAVSIMEFAHLLVVHETQYFGDAFGAPEWRVALAEPIPGRVIARA